MATEREWSMDFGPIGLASGEQREVSNQIGGRTLFFGQAIHNTSGDAYGIEIISLCVGDKKQEPPGGEPLLRKRDKFDWKLDGCDGGKAITIVVKNNDIRARTFAVSIVGRFMSYEYD